MTDPAASTPPAARPAATRLKRLGAYARAHWKELLALGLAAIPVLFILFHKGAQSAAQQAISYPAALFGGGGGSAATDPTNSATPSPSSTSTAAAAVKKAIKPSTPHVSVSGGNPVQRHPSSAPKKTAPKAAPAKKVAPPPTKSSAQYTGGSAFGKNPG